MTSIDQATKYTEKLLTDFERELRFTYVYELETEKITLKYFKDMHKKHIFRPISQIFRDFYNIQLIFVKKLKKEYKDKYGS